MPIRKAQTRAFEFVGFPVLIYVVNFSNMLHMMKSVRISQALYASADKEAEVMLRSMAGPLEFWENVGRKAEALLDRQTFQAFLQVTLVEDAQANSLSNNQKIVDLISKGELSKDSVKFFNQALVKDSVADFSRADF